MEYMLFAGSIYYASGGFNDYTGSYSSLEEAITEYTLRNKEEQGEVSNLWDWGQVVYLPTKQIVWESEIKPY